MQPPLKRPHKQEFPVLQRVVPAEGPTTGGIEITLLGQRLTSSLKVLFGDNESPKTILWSDSSLVAILPPAIVRLVLFLINLA